MGSIVVRLPGSPDAQALALLGAVGLQSFVSR
jgi:hypothetical protein